MCMCFVYTRRFLMKYFTFSFRLGTVRTAQIYTWHLMSIKFGKRPAVYCYNRTCRIFAYLNFRSLIRVFLCVNIDFDMFTRLIPIGICLTSPKIINEINLATMHSILFLNLVFLCSCMNEFTSMVLFRISPLFEF